MVVPMARANQRKVCRAGNICGKGQIHDTGMGGNAWRVRGSFLKKTVPGGNERREREAGSAKGTNLRDQMGHGTLGRVSANRLGGVEGGSLEAPTLLQGWEKEKGHKSQGQRHG